ncbi:unnamed protein product [Arabidopsis lyrata]|uniref:Uncharacterized protein n=1 Tax=Arabidopsis lyrata subsp. lyrata TaxID=81972 RepID=D7KRC1_ARALL|nr:hypothetical protein ARALYDRAFT_893970 [Arabidopsis lyrata subsp. lyrata]CAH8277890.1 unnamed protein product [Arabidopsis lyrata]
MVTKYLSLFFDSFLHIHRNRGQNSHGYSKSRMGCFNGSFYIFPLSRSVGKKWTLEILLIAIFHLFKLIILTNGFYVNYKQKSSRNENEECGSNKCKNIYFHNLIVYYYYFFFLISRDLIP